MATVLQSPSIEEIAGDDANPILRNLRITLAYYDLSQRLAARTGGDVINWCSMACWSSKSVGTYIRSEELPPELRAVLASHADVNARITEAAPGAAADDAADHLERVAREVLADVSQYLIIGNKIVFAEVGSVFNAFADRFPANAPRDDEALEEFVATLSPGDAQPDRVTMDPSTRTLGTAQQGGQGWLASAARHYYEAAFTPDPKSRAELVLLGNGEIGMHEQTRLDPYLAGSLDASVADVVSNRWKTALLDRVVDTEARGRLEARLTEILSELAPKLAAAFQDIATRTMMSLQLPGQLVHMGRDLRGPVGSPLYPPIVEDLQNQTLRDVFQRFSCLDTVVPHAAGLAGRLRQIGEEIEEDVDGPIGFGTAASDWTSYPERMRFILPLFRSRHQTMSLLGKPFTDDQIGSIRQGIVPPGPLS
jgi:hypothetical protein